LTRFSTVADFSNWFFFFATQTLGSAFFHQMLRAALPHRHKFTITTSSPQAPSQQQQQQQPSTPATATAAVPTSDFRSDDDHGRKHHDDEQHELPARDAND
jgi:hypothetical protein